MSALVVLFFLFDGVTKLLRLPPVMEATTRLGYSESSVVVIGVIALVCTVLYAIPATAALGAVMLTGFLGGATATNLRAGTPVFSHLLFPAYIGVLLWAGLLLLETTAVLVEAWTTVIGTAAEVLALRPLSPL